MGWIRCTCDAHGKQMDVKQLYNPVPQTVRVSWNQLVGVRVAVRGSENQLPAEGLGPQDPRLSSATEWERSVAIVRGTWGQYVAVCSVSNSPLTHNPFTTLSHKVWEVCFYKEVCSFVIIVDYVSACICIRIVVSRLYNRLMFAWKNLLLGGAEIDKLQRTPIAEITCTLIWNNMGWFKCLVLEEPNRKER